MASPTTNKGFTYPTHGGAINAWDSPLNENFEQIDSILGDTYKIVIGSTVSGAVYNSTNATISSTVANTTIDSSLSQKLFYDITGTLTQNVTIKFPEVGSFYIFNNETSGDFQIFIKTTHVSTVSVSVSGKSLVVTDGRDPFNIQPETAFASGTRMVFVQAAPPTGWTQLNFDDRVLRLVSGGSGGDNGGSWTISGVSVDGTSLSVGQLASHDHVYDRPAGDVSRDGGTASTGGPKSADQTDNRGSNATHTHGVTANGNWRPAYTNAMACSKD